MALKPAAPTAGIAADDGAAGAARPGLRRVLGFWEVTAGGVGIIIGAGIYVLLGAATAKAGAAVWVAFLLAAALSLLTGLSYAELASMFPRASSEFEFTRHVAPVWVAAAVGWVMIGGLVIAAAGVSLGFARYLGAFLPAEPRVAALALLVVVTALAASGVKRSARVVMALAAVQIGGLLLVIAIGVPHLGQQDLTHATGAGGIAAAAALIFFAFIGFDEVITLAEETRDPARTVPRALITALGISTALYVAVAVAAVSVLGAGALGTSERPLADVVGHAAGDRGTDIVAAIALLSTANTMLLALTAASRMLFGIASQGGLPLTLAGIHRGTGTPIRAIMLAATLTLPFILVGDLTLAAGVTDFAIYIIFIAVNATVIILRRRRPDLARPLRIPGSVGGVPVLPVLGLLSVALMLTRLEGNAILLGLGLCAMALLTARALRSHAGPDATWPDPERHGAAPRPTQVSKSNDILAPETPGEGAPRAGERR